MLRIIALLVLCFVCLSFSACVTKKKYSDLEAELLHTLGALSEEKAKERDKESKREQEKEGIEAAEIKAKDSEDCTKKCQEDLLALQTRYHDLEKVNLTLSRNIEDLKFSMKKRNSIINLQEKVIGLLDDTKKTIETNLKEQIAELLIKIESVEGKLKVSFTNKILFGSGSAAISKGGKKLLSKLASSLKKNKKQLIMVEGHTDDAPLIKPWLRKKFPTNWELSAARAVAVVRFLQEDTGLDPERLSACGYGYYRPVASNDTEENRRLNRRIEIVLIPSK